MRKTTQIDNEFIFDQLHLFENTHCESFPLACAGEIPKLNSNASGTLYDSSFRLWIIILYVINIQMGAKCALHDSRLKCKRQPQWFTSNVHGTTMGNESLCFCGWNIERFYYFVLPLRKRAADRLLDDFFLLFSLIFYGIQLKSFQWKKCASLSGPHRMPIKITDFQMGKCNGQAVVAQSAKEMKNP